MFYTDLNFELFKNGFVYSCISGDVVVDVIDEVAADTSPFISIIDSVAPSGIHITLLHY